MQLSFGTLRIMLLTKIEVSWEERYVCMTLFCFTNTRTKRGSSRNDSVGNEKSSCLSHTPTRVLDAQEEMFQDLIGIEQRFGAIAQLITSRIGICLRAKWIFNIGSLIGGDHCVGSQLNESNKHSFDKQKCWWQAIEMLAVCEYIEIFC